MTETYTQPQPTANPSSWRNWREWSGATWLRVIVGAALVMLVLWALIDALWGSSTGFGFATTIPGFGETSHPACPGGGTPQAIDIGPPSGTIVVCE